LRFMTLLGLAKECVVKSFEGLGNVSMEVRIG
jgi:hypothetical protein